MHSTRHVHKNPGYKYHSGGHEAPLSSDSLLVPQASRRSFAIAALYTHRGLIKFRLESNRMNFYARKHLTLVLILHLVIINELLCAPVQQTNPDDSLPDLSRNKRQIPDIKKDIFVSRGWGAGGMPFSVLYMSPYSSKAPIQSEAIYKAAPLIAPRPREQHMKLEAPPRQYVKSRRQYSVIPQLFVSYGWAPIGKK